MTLLKVIIRAAEVNKVKFLFFSFQEDLLSKTFVMFSSVVSIIIWEWMTPDPLLPVSLLSSFPLVPGFRNIHSKNVPNQSFKSANESVTQPWLIRKALYFLLCLLTAIDFSFQHFDALATEWCPTILPSLHPFIIFQTVNVTISSLPGGVIFEVYLFLPQMAPDRKLAQ